MIFKNLSTALAVPPARQPLGPLLTSLHPSGWKECITASVPKLCLTNTAWQSQIPIKLGLVSGTFPSLNINVCVQWLSKHCDTFSVCSSFQLKLVFSHLKVFLLGNETPKQRKKSRCMKRNEQLSSAQCFLNRAVGWYSSACHFR